MGQAFDDEGRVLGEASGATKREVFEKLTKAHPDAAEIRVGNIKDAIREVDPVEGMPAYRCHKLVHALQVAEVSVGRGVLVFAGGGIAPRHKVVGFDWIQTHNPEPGGYYVVDEYSYATFSPAKAFEEGHALIEVKPAPAPPSPPVEPVV